MFIELNIVHVLFLGPQIVTSVTRLTYVNLVAASQNFPSASDSDLSTITQSSH